jgi:hypothetical protein
MKTRVVMDHAKIAAIVQGMPLRAHSAAATASAEAAASAIGGSGTGALAADVRASAGGSQLRSAGGRFASGFGSSIGSSLPYARIEHTGGWIVARNPDAYGRRLLYIRPGEITATAERVYHQGKGYLNKATETYVGVMPGLLKANFPR